MKNCYSLFLTKLNWACALSYTNDRSGSFIVPGFIASFALLSMQVGLAQVTNTNTAEVFATIQAAIDDTDTDDGHTLEVSAGMYSVASTIVVHKKLTINGPQAGVDPRPVASTTRTPGDANEAIVDGGGTLNLIFSIQASDVVLNGLEIKSGTSDLISSPNGANISGVQVKYCIIHNATGDEGIQLRDVDGGTVAYNYLFDIAQDAVNMCCGSANSIIEYNEITTSNSSNGVIYLYDIGTGMEVRNNLLYGNTNNDGIKFGDNGEGSVNKMGVVADNTVTDQPEDGISIYAGGVTVSGNTVTGSNSTNGAIYLSYAISDVSITGNTIENNTTNGIRLASAVNAGTVTINGNSIAGNTNGGILNNAATVVNAIGNWWGAADGPSGQGPGSGDAVSTNVDFCGWLDAAPPAGVPASGSGVVTNDDTGNKYCSIQEAIDAASSGHTLSIVGGTFDENVDAVTGGKNLTFAPGSSPGCVNITGNYSLNSGDVVEIEVDGPTACTEYDQFQVDGDLSLGGATLDFQLNYTPLFGESYTLFSVGGTTTGTFDGLAEGDYVFGPNGETFVISYQGGSGNDVVLTPSFRVRLLDCNDILLNEGGANLAWRQVGGFTTSGVTQAPDGSYYIAGINPVGPNVQLRMQYSGGQQVKTVAPTTAVTDFYLVETIIDFETCANVDIAGGVVAHDGPISGYLSTGTTNGVGQVVTQLLPSTYDIRMQYEGGQQVKTLTVSEGDCPAASISFTAVPVTVRLEDCSNIGIDGGDVAQDGPISGYLGVGTTDGTGEVTTHLLPSTYDIRMQYRGGQQVKSLIVDDVNCPAGQEVTFTAIDVPVTFEACDDMMGIDGADIAQDGPISGYLAEGMTGDDGTGVVIMQLIPSNYNIRLQYRGGQEVQPLTVSDGDCGVAELTFTAPAVIIRLEDCDGNPLDGAAVASDGPISGYLNEGNTGDHTPGTVKTYLPASTYDFRMQYQGGQEVISDVVVSTANCPQEVTFVAKKVTVSLTDCVDGIQGGDIDYDGPIGGYLNGGITDVNGEVMLDLLNGTYDFRCRYPGSSTAGIFPNSVQTIVIDECDEQVEYVYDVVPPTAVCQDITVTLDALSAASIVPDDVDNGSTDDCGIDTKSLDIMDFGCGDIPSTQVTLTVTDINSLSSTCVATVTVVEPIPSIPDCPNDIVAEVNGDCMPTVVWAEPNDPQGMCGSFDLVSQTHSPGDAFPQGTTTVTYTYQNDVGTQIFCSFDVTIIDMGVGAGPSITCPAPANPYGTDLGACTATMSGLAPSMLMDDCGAGSLTLTYELSGATTGSGSGDVNGLVFNLGTTTVKYTVTDGSNNTAECSFDVTVEDDEDPTIVCPTDKNVNADANTCTASGLDLTPIVDDNCSVASVTYELTGATTASSPGSGINDASVETFNAGVTTVTYTVTDAQGNENTSCSIDVTVNYSSEATIAGSGTICDGESTSVTVSVTNGTGPYIVEYTDGSNNYTENSYASGASISVTPADGDVFTLVSVTDANGCEITTLSGSASFTVADCAGSLTIADPCACLDNATTLENGQFSELITVEAPPGQSITVSAVTGLYTTGSPAPPAAPFPISVGTSFTETANAGITPGTVIYELEARHIDALGYTLEITDGTNTASISNTCYYPNPEILGLADAYCSDETSVTLMGQADRGDGGGLVSADDETFDILDDMGNVVVADAGDFDPVSLGAGTYTVKYTFDAAPLTPTPTAEYVGLRFQDGSGNKYAFYSVFGTGSANRQQMISTGVGDNVYFPGPPNWLRISAGNDQLSYFGGNFSFGVNGSSDSGVQNSRINAGESITFSLGEDIPANRVIVAATLLLNHTGTGTIETYYQNTLTGTYPVTSPGAGSIDVGNGVDPIDRIVVIGGTGGFSLAVSAQNNTFELAEMDPGFPGCTQMVTQEVTVIGSPANYTLSAVGGTTICSGDGVELQLSGSELNVTYELFLDGSPTGITAAGTGNILSFGMVTAAGDYTAKAYYNPNPPVCMSDMTGTVTVTVASAPDAFNAMLMECPTIYDGNLGDFTLGDADATVSGGAGGVTVSYHNSLANAHAGTNDLDKSSYLSGTTNIWARVEDDATGCYGISIVQLAVKDSPAIELSSAPASCAGNSDGSVTVAVLSGPANYSYAWEDDSNNPVGSTNNTADASNTVSGLAPGIYHVTVTDGNGCTATGSVTVGIEDGEAPTFACPSNAEVNTEAGICMGMVPDFVTGLSATTDNCGDAVFTQSIAAGTLVNSDVTVTITATDGAGNSTSCDVVVKVLDNEIPSVTCPSDKTLNLNANCDVELPDYTGGIVVGDNCGVASVTQSPAPGTVYSTAQVVPVSITVTDDAGNTNTSCSFNVNIVDGDGPTAICKNITVVLNGAGAATIVAADVDGGSFDNCDGTPSLSIDDDSFDCTDIGAPVSVTLTVMGASGSDQCTALVTVLDQTAPVITTCPSDITVECDVPLLPANTNGSAVATDNCTATPTVSFTDDIAGGACPQESVITRTWTAQDVYGNTSTCEQIITIDDSNGPAIACPENITVECDEPNSTLAL